MIMIIHKDENMNDIKYPEEIQQTERASLLDKLIKLQAKARRRRNPSISLHGHARDNPTTGISEGHLPKIRGING
jgi:hypothetical protein